MLNELSSEELPTALRTFHQSIMDYHQRALEPLGLFCVQSTGDVIVVHRSGISVTRSLQSAEEALLNAHYLSSDAVSSKSSVFSIKLLDFNLLRKFLSHTSV